MNIPSKEEVHELAKAKGFWTNPRDPLASLMLVVSELSEAAEELRAGSPEFYLQDGKPEGVGVELADAVLRILDFCGYYGIDLEKAINVKHAFNLTRPHMHGKKL